MKKLATIIIFCGCTIACNNEESSSTEPNNNPVIASPKIINYSVIKMYPHDTSSYTQGLEWSNNTLYEGTGWIGESKLVTVDVTTGKHTKKIELDKSLFGEGITEFNKKIYQLTWTENKIFVYDANTFKKIKEFDWPFQGWGLTHNETQLIISTGGSNLYFVNPETLKIEKTLGVTDNNGYVSDLNELEYVDGMIYANIYGRDYIYKINPSTGSVEGKIDLTGILIKNGVSYDPRAIDVGYVLNGIAYDSLKKSFYVTGKRWPALFEIKLN